MSEGPIHPSQVSYSSETISSLVVESTKTMSVMAKGSISEVGIGVINGGLEGSTDGSTDGITEAMSLGRAEGMNVVLALGSPDGPAVGKLDGVVEGSADGDIDGRPLLAKDKSSVTLTIEAMPVTSPSSMSALQAIRYSSKNSSEDGARYATGSDEQKHSSTS